ncbi:hypothetical protein MMYC01_203447 [Madurella mycetomatis]|uniref:Uncharacterized protein n=1 Tax=Madurella mycetomatis TaxID=100816 RepID=A0A175W8C7_9PEZI|nr:hypothetical protein MMYC01_203447 [Madurella mycetomatis]
MSTNPSSALSLDEFPLSQWVFTGHCSSTAPFIQELLENPNGPTLTSAINYLRDSLPPGLNITGIGALDVDTALFRWLRAAPLPQKYVDLATASCRMEICPLLNWHGEPDALGVGVMATQYIQLGVTAVHVALFIVDRVLCLRDPNWTPPRSILTRISYSIKACIRMNVEFARALSLALCIAVTIVSLDSRYSSYSINAGSFSATAFSISFLVLEFISWEWCQFDAQYFIIPFLFLVPLFCLIGIGNSQSDQRTGTSDQFYRLCFDFGRINGIKDRLHHAVLALSIPIISSFIGWVALRFNRRQRNAGLVETILQISIVVLTLAVQSVLLHSIVSFRGTIAGGLGERNPETEWTLGQVLSLTAWIPLVIEFVCIVSGQEGLKRVWDWKLLREWQLERAPEETAESRLQQ